MEKERISFSGYQVFIIFILSFLQFTVILDFMVIAPLGAILLTELKIAPSQFGYVVSAYAFSAGLSGLLAAGFADKFDRKRLLLFFYAGFLIGTLLCGIAYSFTFLLIARIVTGIFGGVIASISLAIVADLFALKQRGRVMGFIQMSFAASQVLGIPFGIYLANIYNWHAPFLLIVLISTIAGVIILKWMKPVNMHLDSNAEIKMLRHLKNTLLNINYIKAFGTTAFLSIGGFLLMPFSSAFLVENTGISQADLPLVFMFTGMATIVVLPLVGKITDSVGKLKLFSAGTVIASIMIVIYTHLGITPLWEVVVINVIMFAGIMSRGVPATALLTAVPELTDRGAFMSINSSLQQISGGIASVIAGMIVVRSGSGRMEHYDTLGYISVIVMFACIFMMYYMNKYVESKTSSVPAA
jgi:predicted MFS family arabinose efflux permease